VQFSEATQAILAELDALSSRRLTRRDDLGALLELAEHSGKHAALEELSFHAKFISRSYRIMKRIGRDGEGYDRLNSEFLNALERCRSLTRDVLGGAPRPIKERIENLYLELSPSSVEAMLALADDLSWYKNWLLDRRRPRS
jgi:hypothetical protein